MKIPCRAPLLALLAAVAALSALTLSAVAQTPGGEAGPGESSSTETAQGRIIARIQDQTGEDGVDNYRIEFGFFPEWALDEADPWSAAITTRSSWLPSSRFLTKSRIDARADADNRSWLRSSLITVPAQSAQSPGGDSTQITGRVIARYNPDSEGRLRDQFGFGDLRLEFLFVPEWAFTDTASTEEAVERLGADGLPSARYLSVTTIDTRRDVWLRSSTVNVPLRAPVVVIEQPQAPVIDSVSCTPSAPAVDEDVICTATLNGGAPDSYAWSGGSDNGDGDSYVTSFSEAGEHTVSLTVANSAGNDTASTTLTITESLQPPAVDSISCSPSSPTVDESITCTAELSSGAPASYAWSGGSSNGSAATYTTSFSEAGEHTVSLTVTNSAGSDTDSTTVSVSVEEAVQAPVIDGINCTPSSPAAGEDITCIAGLSGGAPQSYQWRAGSSSGGGETHTTSFSKAGEYTVSLTVINSAGNDTESTTLTVTEPLQPLVIESISCPRVSTSDLGADCTATLSGGAPTSWAWSGGGPTSQWADRSLYHVKFLRPDGVYAIAPGDYTISLTVTNADGSDSESITLTVTEPPPVIMAVRCSPATLTVNESVTCLTFIIPPHSHPSYAWSGGASGSGSEATYTTSFSEAGEHTVSLTATNSGGSDTESTTLTVTEPIEPPLVQGPTVHDTFIIDTTNVEEPTEQAPVDPPAQGPTIHSMTCSPASPTLGESPTCTASLGGGAPESYAWSGGGKLGSDKHYMPSFIRPGERTITLTVTNSNGSDSDSITITVLPPPPTLSGITCLPASPTVDESVTCMAALSGGAPSAWAWSGGASSSGSEATYTTSFDTAGRHTVSLTVTNSNGSDSDSITITAATANVEEPTEPPPVINFISCHPDVVEARYDDVTCSATLSGGAPDSWVWLGGEGDSAARTYTTEIYETNFNRAGEATVLLTVTNSAGSDTKSTTLIVVAPW